MQNIREKVNDGIINLNTMPLGKVIELREKGNQSDQLYIADYLHDRMHGIFSKFMKGEHSKADVARIYSDIDFENETRKASNA